MPWKSTSVEAEQVRFIQHWQEGRVDFAQLCRLFGLSRKTGYKRLRRFEAYGFEGLSDRSRAPHSHPNQTEARVAEMVVEAKRAHLTWGPRKLIAYLRERQPEVSWPAPSTAGGILQRAGLVRPRRQRRRAAPWGQPFAQADAPNDVWCVDFKGWFRTADGQRCDPLTVADAASRYLLVCQGLSQPRGPQVRRVLEHSFREYGLPQAIRTDNGPPFASVALGGLSPLAVWWIRLGIVPERITPGHPEQNGRLERLHRTLKADTARPRPAGTPSSAPSTTSGSATTPSGPTRPWASAPPRAAISPPTGPTRPGSQSSPTRQGSRCGGCAPTARSSGGAVWSMWARPCAGSRWDWWPRMTASGLFGWDRCR